VLLGGGIGFARWREAFGDLNKKLVRTFFSDQVPSVTGWASLFRGRTLSRRILAPVLPAVMGVLLLMGGVSYLLARHQIVDSAHQFMSGEAANTAHTFELFFQQRFNDLDSLAGSNLFRDYYMFNAIGESLRSVPIAHNMESLFSSVATRTGAYYNIFYVTNEGHIAASLLPAEANVPLSSEELDRLHRRDSVSFPFLPVKKEGHVVKRLVKSVFSERGDLMGTLVVDVDMTGLSNHLASVQRSNKGGAALRDARGQIVLGQPLSNKKKTIEGTAPVRSEGWGSGLSVVAMAPAQEFLKDSLTHIFGTTLLFSLGAAFFLSVLIFNRVSDLMAPIQRMMEGTKRFSSGELTFRFPSLTSLELDALASSFNRMAETLESRNEELEQKIRQLTSLRDLEESILHRQDEETILRTCLESVVHGFSFDRAGFFWVNTRQKEIGGRFLYEPDSLEVSEVHFRQLRFPMTEPNLLSDVVNRKSPRIVSVQGLVSQETVEFCLAPICGKDRVFGVLFVDNHRSGRPLGPSDQEGVVLFANTVGLALENKILFRNLKDSEGRFRTVLENSPDAVIGLSREHWINTWNRGAEKMFGRTEEEVIGKPVSVLFPPTAQSEFKRVLSLVMEKGSARDFFMPGKTREGKALDLSVSWGGAFSDFWMNKEWTLAIRDVTDSRRLQQQLIRSEKLSAVGQLISGIAHELNNPLQAVVGYADILSEDLRHKMRESLGDEMMVKPKEIVNDLRIITDNAMRCQKIIENLLLFVRQGEIEKRSVEIPRIIRACQELLQYKLKKAANVTVEVDLPEVLPNVRGNFQQLEQVFVNLINNACDAMGTGPQKKLIRITVRELRNGTIRVDVSDNGPGVPDCFRSRLFEPFFTTKTEGRGTGLGLPVCRQIVEDHGGRIGYTANGGVGSTFWFELPQTRVDSVPAVSSDASFPAVHGKSLLIVDDEPDVLGFLSKVILATGNHVEVASNLKDAIQRASQKTFDLVLSDVRLGEGTGFSLYENWSLWTPFHRPTFLFMTGDVLNGSVVQDIEKRGLHLLHKPLDLNGFYNTINKALSTPPPPTTTTLSKLL